MAAACCWWPLLRGVLAAAGALLPAWAGRFAAGGALCCRVRVRLAPPPLSESLSLPLDSLLLLLSLLLSSPLQLASAFAEPTLRLLSCLLSCLCCCCCAACLVSLPCRCCCRCSCCAAVLGASSSSLLLLVSWLPWSDGPSSPLGPSLPLSLMLMTSASAGSGWWLGWALPRSSLAAAAATRWSTSAPASAPLLVACPASSQSSESSTTMGPDSCGWPLRAPVSVGGAGKRGGVCGCSPSIAHRARHLLLTMWGLVRALEVI